jgi:hypothetical protein
MKNLIKKILKEELNWLSDSLKSSIELKLEDLEKGDIVIPSCLKEGEFVVVEIGLTVSLGEESVRWVNMKKLNGQSGVFISSDNDIGKSCRFILKHRKPVNGD